MMVMPTVVMGVVQLVLWRLDILVLTFNHLSPLAWKIVVMGNSMMENLVMMVTPITLMGVAVHVRLKKASTVLLEFVSRIVAMEMIVMLESLVMMEIIEVVMDVVALVRRKLDGLVLMAWDVSLFVEMVFELALKSVMMVTLV